MRELSGGDPWRIRSGITTVSSRRAGTAASSSSLEAQELDEVQYGLGEGSCLTAARDRALVLFPDLRVEPRWPRHAGHMVSRDIGSVLAVPFELQDGDCAALNLSSRDVHQIDPRRVNTAQGYADQASSTLELDTQGARAPRGNHTVTGDDEGARPEGFGRRRRHGSKPVLPGESLRHPAGRVQLPQ